MSIRDLKNEVSKSKSKPMGVKVGVDLWKDLNSENEIEEIEFCPSGKPDCIVRLPVLKDSTTVVWPDPDLPASSHVLPK